MQFSWSSGWPLEAWHRVHSKQPASHGKASIEEGAIAAMSPLHFLASHAPAPSNRQLTRNFILLFDLGICQAQFSKDNFHLDNFNTECRLQQTVLRSSLNPKELCQDHLDSAHSESLLYHIANCYYSNLIQNELCNKQAMQYLNKILWCMGIVHIRKYVMENWTNNNDVWNAQHTVSQFVFPSHCIGATCLPVK